MRNVQHTQISPAPPLARWASLLAAVAIGLALLFGAPVVQAQEQGEARIIAERDGGFSPYDAVRYMLWITPNSATISFTRTLAGGFGQERKVGLLTAAAREVVIKDLARCQLDALPSLRAPARFDERWTFTVERGARRQKIVVTDPNLQADRRYKRCLDVLQRTARARLGELPFRDVFFEPGRFGYLQVLSTPTARVIIDGDDMARESPIYGIRLTVGEHEIRFKDEDGGIDRVYTVKILPDVTTNLDVELW